MTRTDFIKSLIGLFGITVLPKNIVRQYQKIYLLQSFIRGFRFSEGPELLSEMKEGDMLELVREPDNPHDPCAIALHFNDHHVGYLPREDNEMLSRLLDASVINLMAEITHLKREAAAWENVHIAVYVLKDVSNETLPKQAGYLTILDTPHYRTLKYKNGQVARVLYDPSEENNEDYQHDGEDFYEAMVEHSKTDEVYTLIHTDFSDPKALEEAVSERKIIINRRQLPADIEADKVIRALDDAILELDHFFDENGYVVANVNRLAELSSRIDHFAEVTDKSGRRFFQVLFRK